MSRLFGRPRLPASSASTRPERCIRIRLAPKEIAGHQCMSLRGIEATGATTLTSSRLRTPGIHLRNTSGLDREGVARALQVAGQVTGESARLSAASDALAGALADPLQRAVTASACLCHGSAGLAHLAATAAADATPATANRIRSTVPGLIDAIAPHGSDPTTAAVRLLTGSGPGLLEGAAGIALAVLRPAGSLDPRSRWDACLLIT
jgi:hypothetical protein